jgi:hypothetical protein
MKHLERRLSVPHKAHQLKAVNEETNMSRAMYRSVERQAIRMHEMMDRLNSSPSAGDAHA